MKGVAFRVARSSALSSRRYEAASGMDANGTMQKIVLVFFAFC